MRERLTWQKNSNPRQAATQRRADIYEMNQEHPQPGATDYESGNPDEWAETPASNKSVELEYDGDHVKRNEIGLPEFRADTWDHKDSDKWNGKGKYDNQRLATEQRARLAMRIASHALRTDNKTLVEHVALNLMGAPDKVLVSIATGIKSASPDSLQGEVRFRRSLACTKIAARLLGENGNDEEATKLAIVISSVDDPTLRKIVSLVRTSQKRVAAEGDAEDKPEEHAAAEKADDEPKKDEPVAAMGKEEEDCDTAMDQNDPNAFSAAEAAELEALLGEQGESGDAALMQLFTPPTPAAPVVDPVMPVMVASDLEISFDQDEAPEAAASTQIASLDDLFADNDEVRAQRQISAAQSERTARELGFGSVGRTASAKKLGQVTRTASVKPEDLLSKLWG
jgi:hypothetical protein